VKFNAVQLSQLPDDLRVVLIQIQTAVQPLLHRPSRVSRSPDPHHRGLGEGQRDIPGHHRSA
jgi:hypothetical protein